MTVPDRKKLNEAGLPLAAISEAVAREKTIHTSWRLAFGDRVLPGSAALRLLTRTSYRSLSACWRVGLSALN